MRANLITFLNFIKFENFYLIDFMLSQTIYNNSFLIIFKLLYLQYCCIANTNNNCFYSL